jgi:hypothetical protein
MNKQFLFIFILGLVYWYCFSYNHEYFTRSLNYYHKNNKRSTTIISNVPTGKWKDTCTVLDFRDPILWATCENDRGKYKETSINVNKCSGRRIRNVNGFLECD